MNLDKEQNIDKVIRKIINGNDPEISNHILDRLIQIKKLAIKKQKNNREYGLKLQEIELKKEENFTKDRQGKFPNNLLSNPTTIAVIVALAGFITSSLVAFIQGNSNLQLEELKFQSGLIAKSTKSPDKEKRKELLQFNIDAGLIKNPYIISKLNSLIKKGDVPQSAVSQIVDPNRTILPSNFHLRTVNDFTGFPGCYIAAYSHTKENSVDPPVGDEIYVMGQVRVPGKYQGRVCQPKGYENKDISSLDYFKELFDNKLPAVCKNKSCWPGGDTGGFVGAF